MNAQHDDLDVFIAQTPVEGKRVRTIPWHRIFLTSAVSFGLFWVFADCVDELRFHFSNVERVDLGNVADLPTDQVLPINAYVSLEGVLGAKAATIAGLRPGSFRRGPVQVRQLLGAPIFVEFDQAKLGTEFQTFQGVSVSGRLVALDGTGELRSVHDYFIRALKIPLDSRARVLIVDDKPGEMWRYPVIFSLFTLIAGASLMFTVRSFKVQVVDDEIVT